MSRRSLPAAAVAALVVSAMLLAACGKGGEAKANAPGNAPPPMPVTVVRVESRTVPIALEAVGQAEGARVSGIIEKRLYEEGSTVAAGQELFLIDPAPYELAVQEARAAVQQERVRRELAEVEAKRLQPLVEERAVSQRELDQQIATARQSGAAIAAAEARLKEAELNLSYTRLRAPIAGITGRALRSEGSLVTANTDAALLTTLTQVNPIWVRFPLAESDFNRVRGAQRNARVQMVGEDGQVVADGGKLNFAGTTVDPKLGAVQLRAEFPNPGVRWLPGQFIKVKILAGEQKAILVPQTAVLNSEQSRIVMTVGADNKVSPRPIQTASWIGGDIVVTGGLKEGDAVIVDNLVKLRPGATVQPHAPGEAPQGAPQGAAGAPPKAGADAAKPGR
jgi:membrane fusion protein (multidrug efflux system)